jgi:DNA-binding NtrC family response regulator
VKNRSLAVGVLVLAGAASGTELLACGDKFLVVSRGTRFQRSAAARRPANILVYLNPAGLGKVSVDATLSKAGYRPTTVAGADAFDKALRQGGWDVVLVDLADGAAIRARLQGRDGPVVLPVAQDATDASLARAKKEYARVVKAPLKTHALLEAVDEALALHDKLRTKAGKGTV